MESLYLLFESTQVGASLPDALKNVTIPGYTFSEYTLKPTIQVPGEPDFPVRSIYFTENYFRIFVSDLVIEFFRQIPIPEHLRESERFLISKILMINYFNLRRWVLWEGFYDEDDNPQEKIIAENKSIESLLSILNI